MFSGIVETRGRVRRNTGARIEIAAEDPLQLSTGASVAVNGCCLTVAEVDVAGFSADVMPETAARTTLAELAPGDAVNLEASLRLGDAVGGHLVTGHIDATGTVTTLRLDGNATRVTIEAPESLVQLVAAKGSIAVDGISLTVTDVSPRSFSVSLIPHTLRVTTAGTWRAGSRVNLEADLIARYVEAALRAQAHMPAAASRSPQSEREHGRRLTLRPEGGGLSEQAGMWAEPAGSER